MLSLLRIYVMTDTLRLRRAAVTLDVPGVRRDTAALVAKLLPVITPLLTGKTCGVITSSSEGSKTTVRYTLIARKKGAVTQAVSVAAVQMTSSVSGTSRWRASP